MDYRIEEKPEMILTGYKRHFTGTPAKRGVGKRYYQQKWVSHNWENSLKVNIVNDNIGKKIVDHGGLILEIGAGPGGGFMPYVLKANPDAAVIISDLSPR